MSYQLQSIRVLIVEDNQPMLELAKSLLSTFGVGMVYTAKNGEDGFKKFQELNPDLVIADWMMKPMDGISLTRRIRNDAGSPNQFVPVILMTGFSEKRRVIQARDAGVTEFLVKPFNARDLYRRIAQVIERPRQFVRSEDFLAPTDGASAQQHILVPSAAIQMTSALITAPPLIDFVSSAPHKKLEDTVQHISKNADKE